jgi:hypothetical protein
MNLEGTSILGFSRARGSGGRSTLFGNRIEWLMLECNSGLRPGEQAMLEFSDIDLVHGFIHVPQKPDLGFHIKNYQTAGASHADSIANERQ